MNNKNFNSVQKYLSQKYAISGWVSSQKLKELHADMILYLGCNGYVDDKNIVSVKKITEDNDRHSKASISVSLSDLWRMDVVVKKVLADDQRGKWLNLTDKGNQLYKSLEKILFE